MYLLIGLCFMNLAPTLVAAQRQSYRMAMVTGTHDFPSPAQLRNRVQEADQELSTIREQMSVPLTDDAKRALLERIEHLEREVQQINRNLDAAKRQQMRSAVVDATATSGCCQLGTNTGVSGMHADNTAYCKRGARNVDVQSMSPSASVKETCLTRSRLIQSKRLRNLTVDLANDRGLLAKGQNDFCIQFRNTLVNSPANPGEVKVEATMAKGKIRAIRAIVKLSRANMDRYCAQVNLPMPGVWTIAVEHAGPLGKGKAVFVAAVN